MTALAGLRRRSDYTFRHNLRSGRHGWLRLTPAYSVRVVEDILAGHGAARRVLDPFCGTGTTAVCAAGLGLESVTTDVNPFLVWLADAKTRPYACSEVEAADDAAEAALAGLGRKWEPAAAPNLYRIERWWSEDDLEFLRALKGALESVEAPQPSRDLLRIAFCRTLIGFSNAAFNHQSMSFRSEGPMLDLVVDRERLFRADVAHVLNGARESIPAGSRVLLRDARRLDPEDIGRFDLVITSPPYANRMSYVRELRPYMYWLDFLSEAKQAGELDWRAIGGTWGVATSRLGEWTPEDVVREKRLSAAVAAIAETEGRNANLLAKYVLRYFQDIRRHLTGLPGVLNPGARVHYIVGNSKFYGTLVDVEDIYATILREAGFAEVEVTPIRKRNSKKELVEFDVSARWPGGETARGRVRRGPGSSGPGACARRRRETRSAECPEPLR